jgi:hypothetical protein
MRTITNTARAASVILSLLLAGPLTAQTPEARPADVASVDAILQALYDVISGPAGQTRDWNRFRSLFLPDGRLISTGRTPAGEARYRVMTPDEYATGSATFLEASGFMEREIARRLESFGNIAQAFSTYESHYTQENQARHARGINSIQLYNDGKRWFVVTVFWDSERPDQPIPAKYLSGG